MLLFFRRSSVSTFMLQQFQRMCYYGGTGTTAGNGSNCEASKCTEEGYQGCGDNNVWRNRRHGGWSWKENFEEVHIILLFSSNNTDQSFSSSCLHLTDQPKIMNCYRQIKLLLDLWIEFRKVQILCTCSFVPSPLSLFFFYLSLATDSECSRHLCRRLVGSLVEQKSVVKLLKLLRGHVTIFSS